VEYFNYLGSMINLTQDLHCKLNKGLPLQSSIRQEEGEEEEE
jgi:hypothetical protein